MGPSCCNDDVFCVLNFDDFSSRLDFVPLTIDKVVSATFIDSLKPQVGDISCSSSRAESNVICSPMQNAEWNKHALTTAETLRSITQTQIHKNVLARNCEVYVRIATKQRLTCLCEFAINGE